MAQTIGQLIAFRVLQGVGGGMLTPVGIAMLFRAFPPAERAKASTVVMVPTLVAPAMGPVLGGFITTNFHWRWIFWVNVPIALVALWFGWRYLREHREPSARGFDVAGFVLSGAALALIVFALSEGPRAGWTSDVVLLTGPSDCCAAVLTVFVELRVENPMLDLRLLGEPNVPSVQHGGLLLDRQLPRGHLRDADLPAEPPRHVGAAERPHHVPAGVRGDGVVVHRRLGLRPVGPRRLMSGGFFAAAMAISLFTMLRSTPTCGSSVG